ncbi:MAG: phospholipase [Betaproteobacteria bacterium]|nr:phospholipase [Betaproteobacteria bacterium]
MSGENAPISAAAADDGIEHVVLLMLENHSFDQMLGALQQVIQALDGVTPASAATRQNLTRNNQPIFQQETSERQMQFDPPHEFVNVRAQLENNNGGFVREFQKERPKSTERDWREIMGYYPLDFLPALHTLGREYTVCDRWFASLPGPTWPNRFFALTGSCTGEVEMPSGAALLNPKWYTEQKQATIFDRLSEKNKSWKIYYYDFPCSLLLTHQRQAANLAGYCKFSEFFKAAQNKATFPAFTFIEPQYFGVGQNDDHPPHNIMKAEKLIGDVYNALRSNAEIWNSCLLVVVYDEHGGFYDHVVPPAAVPPDANPSTTAKIPYDFRQLGVRVPALLISPKCKQGVEKTQFDHTSLLKYLTDKWGLGPLGARTAAANSIGVAIDKALRRTDTTPFVRVPGVDLVPEHPDAEKDATNSNQDALHHFAEFLNLSSDRGMAEGVQLVADVAKVGTWWSAAKHDVGQWFSSTGTWLSKDLRAANRAREDKTAQAFKDLLKKNGLAPTANPPK